MYESEANQRVQANSAIDGFYPKGKEPISPTVGENIDAKIACLQAEIKRLEESRETLAPLLGMKINDLRSAMQY